MTKHLVFLSLSLIVNFFLAFAANAVETPSLNALSQTKNVNSSSWIHWTRVNPN